MTTLPQRRLSDATLLLGALLSAVGYFLEPSTSRQAVIVPASWLIFGGTILMLISLSWFHVGVVVLDRLRSGLRAALRDIHRLVDELRPVMLDERGPARAIRERRRVAATA